MSTTKKKEEHRSTARVLDIFELLADAPDGYTLTQLSEATQSPKSSLFPIVHTMEERGYLKQDAVTRCYRIHRMTYQVGSAYLRHQDVLEEIEELMRHVVDACGETCHFATRNGKDVLYLKKVDSPHAVRMISTVGSRLPAYGTGLGKALLTDFSEAELKALYPHGLKALTEHTVTDFRELFKQLEESRQTGYSFEREESNSDICCVAVPVRKNGVIVAAFSIAVPVFRYTEEKSIEMRQLLWTAAAQTEQLLRDSDVPFLPGE